VIGSFGGPLQTTGITRSEKHKLAKAGYFIFWVQTFASFTGFFPWAGHRVVIKKTLSLRHIINPATYEFIF